MFEPLTCPVRLQVLAFFTQSGNHDDEGTGLALDYIANGLRAEGISEKDLRAAVDFFANDRSLYPTIERKPLQVHGVNKRRSMQKKFLWVLKLIPLH
jgi:hypothetical protein